MFAALLQVIGYVVILLSLGLGAWLSHSAIELAPLWQSDWGAATPMATEVQIVLGTAFGGLLGGVIGGLVAGLWSIGLGRALAELHRIHRRLDGAQRPTAPVAPSAPAAPRLGPVER